MAPGASSSFRRRYPGRIVPFHRTAGMPLLFLVFGALLDFVLFIALYSWIASTAPPGAAASTPTGPAPSPP